MPKQNNCIPLTKNIIQIVLGHPATGSPNAKVFITIISIKIKETIQNKVGQKDQSVRYGQKQALGIACQLHR